MAIGRETAQVGHEHPLFAGDISAHIPTVGCRLEADLSGVLDMVPPVLFGRLGSFDAGVITRRHIADAVGDPFDMLFDGWQHIGQNRRAARAGDGE